MKVNISNAINVFFPKPSLEYVYYEAIANSLDAGATSIEIKIEIDSFSDCESLKIIIKDNGEGFTDKNFEKFSKLLENEEIQHKGVGRLVFLNYFKTVTITSGYDDAIRKFVFSDTFDGKSKVNSGDPKHLGTLLEFNGYKKEKIKSYSYLVPESLKQSVFQHFLPRLYQYKMEGKELSILFSLTTMTPNPEYKFDSSDVTLTISDLPQLKEVEYTDESIDFFAKFKLMYSIKKNYEFQTVITSICADGRTIPVDIISGTALPKDYEIIFLLYSDYFDGKTNTSREALTLEDDNLKLVKKLFRDSVVKILYQEMPNIKQQNEKLVERINSQYPHLQGYFEEQTVGLIDKVKTLDDAQRKFFIAQKEILEANSLTDEQYEKSLELSSRLLTEYILYRDKIIQKLKGINVSNNEGEIHDIIVPKKRRFHKDQIINDIFANNAWILDDRYMSYSVILSDLEMNKLFNEFSENEKDSTENGRPDIAIIFSNPPSEEIKIDVVIIELKKLGLGLAKKEEVVSQLKQRARALIDYYPGKIQRIWFYGIVDFDNEFRRTLLEERFIKLFSKADLYYKEHPIIPNIETLEEIPVSLYILSYDAFLMDAEARNETFLKILKEGIKSTLKDQS